MNEAKQDATALQAIQQYTSDWDSLSEAQREKFRAEWKEDDRRKTLDLIEAHKAEQLQQSWEKLCPDIYRDNLERDRLKGDPRGTTTALAWRYSPHGMLLLGPTGQGKTRCVWAALKGAHFEGYRIHAIDGIGFANEAAAAAYSPESTEKWMMRLTDPDILFIDDLAKRFTATSGQLLFGLVERRVSRRKPIIITTNLTGAQIENLINDPELSKPLLRRIREFCNPIAL